MKGFTRKFALFVTLVVLGVLFVAISTSYADDPEDEVELSHEMRRATELGITGEFDDLRMGISIPMDPDAWWFRFYVDERERFEFNMVQESSLATVRMGFELTDSTGDNILDTEIKQCGSTIPTVMAECDVSMRSDRLDAGYYFLKVYFTPPGVWDEAIDTQRAWLTWDVDGTSRSNARPWIPYKLRGFIDEDEYDHWYVIEDLSPGQDVVLNLWGESGSDLDVAVYADEDEIDYSGSSSYPQTIYFTTPSDDIYVQITNRGGDNTEYALTLDPD